MALPVACTRTVATDERGPACLGADAGIEHALGRWWVLQTHARNEKVVAGALARQGVAHYLPLVRRPRVYGGRRLTVELPLFPGYVFLCGDAGACDAAWQTRRVSKILRVHDQQGLRTELRQVQRLVESDETAELYPALVAGRRCRVVSGSLRGIEGVVIRRRRASRLYVAVTILGQSAVVEIDGSLLEAID